MNKSILVFLLLFETITGCVDEIKLSQDAKEAKLIVDGTITNAVGPYTVTLNYSLPYTEAGITQSISGARVSIVEVGGKTANFTELSTGIYQTDSAAIRGQVGKAYFLKIRLGNGREYQSKPETILPPVPVDSFKVAFIPDIKNKKPFILSVKTKDPVEKGNFYRWKWTHYDTVSICKNSYTVTEGGRFNYKTFCCQKCWQIEPCVGCINIASDALTNGRLIESDIAQLPFESKKPYFIVLEQYSISSEYYQFWKSVGTQINNSGGIFDNAPAQIQGNLFNINNSEEQVLGYFAASGVSLKPIYVPRNVIGFSARPPLELANFDVIYQPDCAPCRGISRTPNKPLGWVE